MIQTSRTSEIRYLEGEPKDRVEVTTGGHVKSCVDDLGPSWLAIDREINAQYEADHRLYPDDDLSQRVVFHTAEDFKTFYTNLTLAGCEAFGDEAVGEAYGEAVGSRLKDALGEAFGALQRVFADTDEGKESVFNVTNIFNERD